MCICVRVCLFVRQHIHADMQRSSLPCRKMRHKPRSLHPKVKPREHHDAKLLERPLLESKPSTLQAPALENLGRFIEKCSLLLGPSYIRDGSLQALSDHHLKTLVLQATFCNQAALLDLPGRRWRGRPVSGLSRIFHRSEWWSQWA